VHKRLEFVCAYIESDHMHKELELACDVRVVVSRDQYASVHNCLS
jgi:hypothetical protein